MAIVATGLAGSAAWVSNTKSPPGFSDLRRRSTYAAEVTGNGSYTKTIRSHWSDAVVEGLDRSGGPR